MLALSPLSVPDTVNNISAGLDLLGLDIGQAIACQLSAGAQVGDVVDLYAGNLATITSTAQAVLIGTIGAPATGNDGQAPVLVQPPRFRYIYAVPRVTASTGRTLSVVGQETAGTAGGSGITGVTGVSPIVTGTGSTPTVSAPSVLVQNGNAFGAASTAGTTDGNDFSIQSGGKVYATAANATGNSTFGAATAAATTRVQSGTTGAVTVDSGTTGAVNLGTGANAKTVTIGNATGASTVDVLFGTGGIGIGVAAPGLSSVLIDTPVAGTVQLGATNATTINAQVAAGGTINVIGVGAATVNVGNGSGGAVTTNLGAAASTSTTRVFFGIGGLGLGAAAPGTSGIAIDTPAAGAITIGNMVATSVSIGAGVVATLTANVAAAGTVNIGTGATAASVNLGTGAAAKTVAVGSSNTSSTTTIAFGTGGLGIGAAAPNTSGIAIDTPAAGTITIGNAVATAVSIGSGAVATLSALVAAGGTINIGGAAAATVNVGAGGGAITTTLGSMNTTSTTRVNSGTGGIGIGVAAPGTSGIAIDTPSAATLRIGAANANVIAIGNTTTSMTLPTMTTTQRNNLAGAVPPVGSIVYNNQTGQPEVNIGLTTGTAVWAAMASQFSQGTIGLTAGVVTVNNVFLTANSVIHVSVANPAPGAGNLTIRYDVLAADRTNSSSGPNGSFKISALNSAGTLQNLDVSTGVRWTIVGQ